MSNTTKRLAAIAAAVTVGLAGAAAMAPDASAASRGTATHAESWKVVHQADVQRCLTLKETRKIVHGNGEQVEWDSTPTYVWYGAKKSSISGLVVEYNHGCAWFAGYLKNDGGLVAWGSGDYNSVADYV